MSRKSANVVSTASVPTDTTDLRVSAGLGNTPAVEKKTRLDFISQKEPGDRKLSNTLKFNF